MKETIKGWIARDDTGGFKMKNKVNFFQKHPFKEKIGARVSGDIWVCEGNHLRLKKTHGLKPGQIKKAKITIEVIK